MPESQKPRKPMNQTPVWERPVKGPISHAAQLPPSNLKRNLLIGAGATAAAGGTYYLHRRGRTKEKEKTVTASKNLVNPYEEVVVFGKAYPVALPVPRSTTIRALVPTGSHVGHGNALKHVRNSKGGGGRATALERYTGSSTKKSSKDISPVAKARGFDSPGIARSLTAATHGAAREEKPNSTARGLMLARSYRTSGVPRTGATAEKVSYRHRMQSNFDNKVMGGDWGSDASRRNASMKELRGRVSFGDSGRKGKRLA